MTVSHASLTGVHLHEPKGIENANSGEVYVADGSGSGAWAPQVTFAYSPGSICGLTIEKGADTTNDVTILPGYCRDATNTEDIVLGASLTKRLDATWAAGTNQGGRDTGSIADDTWHIFVIKNPSTGDVDVLMSTSLTTPTMPSGYTKKRRIASLMRKSGTLPLYISIETEGGGLFVHFQQLYTTSAFNPSSSGTIVELPYVPHDIIVESMIVSSASSLLYVRSSHIDFLTSPFLPPYSILTSTSGTVVAGEPIASPIDTLTLGVVGYKDFRRP